MINQPVPHSLTAIEANQRIRDGLLTSVELVTDCLKRIDATDGIVNAWVHLDRDAALARARELDSVRRGRYPIGPLHGIPVGLKDIIDTKTMPTARGTPIFDGRRPEADAAIVDRLTEAGAVIMGKTVTTELAFMHPAATTNPHSPLHTPGGSSSGSAAAVAAYQVPLAVGTQTNGSVIRPASFCGIYGFKPSRGTISRRGLLQTSNSLDQVGFFGRSLEDVALLNDTLGFYDPLDNFSFPRARAKTLEGSMAEVPVDPTLAWFDLPFADRLNGDTVEAFKELFEILGPRVERIASPPAFANLVNVQRIIHEYEICQHLRETFDQSFDRLSPALQVTVARGRTISLAEYEDALSLQKAAAEYFEVFFKDYDAIITPAATGEAPLISTGGTGDPIFCTLWTLCGLPSVTLPLMVGDNNLPIGLQLVCNMERDDRLLRTANWLINKLETQA